jgi:hypothetical protein
MKDQGWCLNNPNLALEMLEGLDVVKAVGDNKDYRRSHPQGVMCNIFLDEVCDQLGLPHVPPYLRKGQIDPGGMQADFSEQQIQDAVRKTLQATKTLKPRFGTEWDWYGVGRLTMDLDLGLKFRDRVRVIKIVARELGIIPPARTAQVVPSLQDDTDTDLEWQRLIAPNLAKTVLEEALKFQWLTRGQSSSSIMRTLQDIAKSQYPKYNEQEIYQIACAADRLYWSDSRRLAQVDPGGLQQEWMDDQSRPKYRLTDGTRWYWVKEDGGITQFGSRDFSGQWAVRGMTFHPWSKTITPWSAIRDRMDAGETIYGYLWDLDHGTARRWGGKVTMYADPNMA